ncbi:hypothetical protein FQP34_20975 [Peribacillus simplex]|uniref:Uncharacterized protein n=1 Tax=Peribacillus simplex TaxID=1478 RepID=A0A8B5XTD8_9BACI|nr:hypothetical protein [Peribacillus simplex]TVX77628.1 hypothetical protein FQP34_20975 [Peribacillus simplex]
MGKSFHVIKPRITKSDIYYKVYVTNLSIYIIKIGGQFHNHYAYEKQLPDILELLFWFWFKKMEKKQADLEIEYDEKVNNSQVFDLLQKKHNFSINNTDIKDIVINQKGTLHTGFHDNGTISFTLTNGKILKFIIPKTISRKSVTECLKEAQQTLSIKEV